jgi:septum formation protein
LMGQPSSRADARRMLTRLSGRRHRVYTGVAVLRGPRRLVDYECTQVSFRRLSRREIDLYVRTGEPMGKAGAYAVQGKGAALVRAVRGCYTNVVGLPMPKVLEMLAQFEAGAWQMEEARRGRG